MKVQKFLVSMSSGLMLAACASVPKEAPEELHAADRAIRQAESADVARHLPNTIKNAKEQLDEAVTLYEQSDKELKEKKRDAAAAQLNQAKEHAVSAKHLADTAIAINDDLNVWDRGDLSAYESLRRATATAAAARSELDSLRAQQRTVTQPTEHSLELVQAIAFFPTEKAQATGYSRAPLSELARALKADANLTVQLIGHADHRGRRTYNDRLALARAKTVADELAREGIDRARITVESIGDRDAKVTHNRGLLQLDRRVDAQLKVAH